MIKKLQIRFVLLSMSALLVVLTIIIGGINIVNYNGIVRDADILLSILSENKGNFPPPDGNRGRRLPPGMSPEVPYESRFFSVLLDNDSYEVMQTETSRIISVDLAQAIGFAQTAVQTGDTSGFIEDFRYRIQKENDQIRVTFLDFGRRMDAFKDFLFVSVAIAFVGYSIVFGIIVFFSNKIVRPISESYERQKCFITDAGHEIKTPLAIISADVDVLEAEWGENEWLEDIHRQTKRLTALTNDLIYLARMEEAEKTSVMIEFPVSDVISEAAASFQALAQTQDKLFRCEIQPMLSLNGDEKAIRQLIGILLDNALKYSPAGHEVSLICKRQNKMLLLSVCNKTVHTLSKKELQQLFERFYQVDPSRNSENGGHGIGLSVAKAIVLAHNGKIQAKTEDGTSLQIIVSLPIG